MNEEEVIKEQIKMLERSRKNYIHKFKQRQKKKWNDMEQQLQAYKVKEDKLREYLEKIPMSCACGQKQQDEIEKNILQILNEGSDK